jgi:hypothetical protein
VDTLAQYDAADGVDRNEVADPKKVVAEFEELISENDWENLQRFDRYHRGIFEQPYLPSKDRTMLALEYADLLSRADLPICALIVAATADRLAVEGYGSTDSGDVDDTVWSWWQASSLDGRQAMLYTDSLVFGDGFLSVTDGGDVPKYSVESPLNVVVDIDSTDPSRVEVAAKLVKNRGWFYTADAIWALRKSTKNFPRGWEVVSVTPHTAGECPIVRFPNRMDSRGQTLSEIALVAGPQRRIIQTVADRLMIQRSASWRQRWISGISIDTDADGNPIAPMRMGIDQLVVSEDPDTRFGEFSESPMGELLKAVESDIQHAAAISQTPSHLLIPGSISNISADALIALEAGLTTKVQNRQLVFGESWEHAFRIGATLVGHTLPEEGEVLWGDLEKRSEAQKVDAVIKLNSIGLPMEYLLERLSLSPQKIQLILAEIEEARKKAADAAAASFGLAPGQSPLGDPAAAESFANSDPSAPNPTGT